MTARYPQGCAGGRLWLYLPCALSAMGGDLAVDELEAALGLGDLFADPGGDLGEKIAVFTGGGFGVEVQLTNFAG
jgi:hypothetical protein